MRRLETRWADSGGVVLSILVRGPGGAVISPSGVLGEAPAAKRFSRILNTRDDLSGQQHNGPMTKPTSIQ